MEHILISCSKIVMGEPEILEFMTNKFSSKNDSIEVISFVNVEGSVGWFDNIITSNTQNYIVIRTTTPESQIGQECHYIGIFIDKMRKRIIYMNSEHLTSLKLQTFIESIHNIAIKYQYTFQDLTPACDKSALQIHEQDTYCQSWSIYLLLHVLKQRQEDIIKYPNFKMKSPTQKLQFIQKYVIDVVVETEGMFDFSLAVQMFTDYNIEIDVHNIRNTLLKTMHNNLTI